MIAREGVTFSTGARPVTLQLRAATRVAPGLTHGAWSLTRGHSRGRTLTRGITGRASSDTGHLCANTCPAPSDTHCTSFGSRGTPLTHAPHLLLHPPSSRDHPSCPGTDVVHIIPTLGPSRLHAEALVMHHRHRRRHAARLTNHVTRFRAPAASPRALAGLSSRNVLSSVAHEPAST